MSLQNYLNSKKTSESIEELRKDELFTLDEQIDEESLEKFWDQVVEDIHSDPEWYNFTD